MPAVAPILAAILSLRPCATEPVDVPRLTTVAEAIASVSADRYEAGALIVIARYESNFCEAVHSGKKVGYPNGHGLWQIEPGSNLQPPFEGLSFEATEHAAGQALRLWRMSKTCGGDVRKRFGLYAGIGCRSWSGATPRANLYWWLTQKALKP